MSRVSRVAEHTERVRVGWIDTDAGGRIHFTVVFRWAETAETGLYRKLGLLDERKGDYPRRHVEADYLRVLRFEDEVELTIRVEAVGRTSVRFAWEGMHDGEVAVRGTHTIVRVDEGGRPTPIDDRTRSLLAG
jgi:acyl-CoA thioester hydrolase